MNKAKFEEVCKTARAFAAATETGCRKQKMKADEMIASWVKKNCSERKKNSAYCVYNAVSVIDITGARETGKSYIVGKTRVPKSGIIGWLSEDKNKPLSWMDDEQPVILRCIAAEKEWGNGASAKLVGEQEDLDKIREILSASTDPAITKTQSYAVASKENKDGKHWLRLRAMLGEKVVKTMSDAGGVAVGTADGYTIISNDRGDGVTRVAVVEKDEWNSDMARFVTSVEGRSFHVSDYDCSFSPLIEMHGRYGVYVYDGIVIFEKWE